MSSESATRLEVYLGTIGKMKELGEFESLVRAYDAIVKALGTYPLKGGRERA